MAEHEHELVTYLYHVRIPYHLKPQEVTLEPEHDTLSDLPTLLAELAEYRDSEVRAIVKGAAILMEKYPHRAIESCLSTAMVWERG